jgi:hypothetical protein
MPDSINSSFKYMKERNVKATLNTMSVRENANNIMNEMSQHFELGYKPS